MPSRVTWALRSRAAIETVAQRTDSLSADCGVRLSVRSERPRGNWSERSGFARPYIGAVAASVVGQSALVISGPFTARLLGPAGRGELALLAIVATITATLTSVGLPTALAYAAARHGATARRILIHIAPVAVPLSGLGAVASGGIVLVLVAVGRGSSPWVEAPLEAVWTASMLAGPLLLGALQGENRFAELNRLRPLPAVLTAVAVLAMFMALRQVPVVMVLAAYAGANICAVLVIALVARSVLSPVADYPLGFPSARQLAWFGLRSLPGASAPLETFAPDQAIVGLRLSSGSLGLYTVASAFDNFSSLVVYALSTIAFPKLAAARSRSHQILVLRNTLAAATALAALTCVATEIAVGFVLPWAFGSQFVDAVPAARVLIVAGLFLALRRILMTDLQALGWPGHAAIGELVSVGSLALVAAVLVPVAGLIGASAAVLLIAVCADVYLLAAVVSAASRSTFTATSTASSEADKPVP